MLPTFLNARTGPLWFIAILSSALLAPPAWPDTPAPTWVVDPAVPGPDLPPRGRSLFDLLLANAGVADTPPFPFTDLLALLEQQVARTPGGGSSVKKVLIPLGRSLQRNAAAPLFFDSPRVVVAVDSEPDAPGGAPLYLQDRLFLGYQAAAQVVEVISYNPSARRFEFQVVSDYGPGSKPDVRYANRAVCTSCHQNGAPIFSRPGWEETNSTPRVANALARVQPMFHGVPARRSSVDAAAIDNATDRANLLPAYALLWAEGCGSGPAGASCRAQAFEAMVQLRLTAFAHFDAGSSAFRRDFAGRLLAIWAERWPGGLLIPDPDIPNRAPPFLTRTADVPREFDPLNPRPPAARWEADTLAAGRLVAGLAGVLPALDIARLDAGLFERARRLDAPRGQLAGACTLRPIGQLRDRTRVALGCRLSRPGAAEMVLDAELALDADGAVEGRINWLSLADGTRFGGLVLHGGRLSRHADTLSVVLHLAQARGGLHARLADGNAIESLALAWPVPPAGSLPAGGAFDARGTLAVVYDFAAFAAALEALVGRGEQGPFGAGEFDGPALMDAVLGELGLPATGWCCGEPPGLPPARAESPPDPADYEPAALAGVLRHCGACHRSNQPLPPGFLRGDRDRVAANLRHCAPRMFYRLSMWRVPAQAREKSPMPPLQVAAGQQDWAAGEALTALLDFAGSRLGKLAPADVLAADYETLPECLTVPAPG